MIVVRKHPITGHEVTMDIPTLTSDQFIEYLSGEVAIQKVLPHLSDDEREFILSGMLPGEWKKLWNGDDTGLGKEVDLEDLEAEGYDVDKYGDDPAF